MGKGTDAARAAGAVEHADVIDDFKDQLLIVLLNRLGGKVAIPVAEVDDTGGFLCAFSINDGVFNFTVSKTIERSGGGPLPADHRDLNPDTGQQKAYIVLTPEERARGYVRPVRHSYRHLKCGASTRMAQDIAETYARDPAFYTGTFCIKCRTHLPLVEFVWDADGSAVGS